MTLNVGTMRPSIREREPISPPDVSGQESTSCSQGQDGLESISLEQGTFGAASSGWIWLLFAEGLDDKLQIGVCALGSWELFWVCESGIHDDESGAPGFIWPTILKKDAGG